MPFGAILDCSTSTCLQSSASSSPASSSGTHSTKTRTSFQGFCLDSPFVSSCYNCSRLVFFTTFVVYGFVPTIHWSFMNGFGSDEVSTSFERLTLWISFRLVSSCHGCSWCTSSPALPSSSTLPSSLRWSCPGGDWQCLISLQSTGAQYFHRFDILGSSHQWWHLFIFLCLAYCEFCHLCQAFDNTVHLAGYPVVSFH